jgi:hypothetical protein
MSDNTIISGSLVCFNVIEVLRRYSNRSDLLEQLRGVVVILSDSGQDDGSGTKIASLSTRSQRLRDRFCSEDLQKMINLERVGTGGYNDASICTFSGGYTSGSLRAV